MKFKIRKIIVIVVFLCIAIIGVKFIYKKIKEKYKVEDIVSENYVVLYSNGKMGVIDNKGNIVIKPEYYKVSIPNPSKPIFVCYYGYAQQDGTYRTKVINAQGTELFTKFNKVNTIELVDIQTSMPYEKNVLTFEDNGKIGLIDLKGNILVKASYDSITGLSNKEGELLVKKDDKYGVINTSGAELIETKYDYISGDGYYLEEKKYELAGYVLGNTTSDGYRYGYMTSKRKLILDVEYNEIIRIGGIASEDTNKNIFLIAQKNGQYGLMKNKKVLIEFKYQSIDYSGIENLFLVTKNSKNGVLNLEGKKIIPIKYDEIQVKSTYIYTKSEEEEIYFNLNGNRIDKSTIKEEEKEIANDKEEEKGNNKLIPSEKDGKWGFIDKNNNIIVDYLYDKVTEFNNNGYAGIMKDGKWGSINENGEIIIEPTYNLDGYYEISFIGKYYKVVYDYKTIYYSNDIK